VFLGPHPTNPAAIHVEFTCLPCLPPPPAVDKHSDRPGLLRELISNSFSFNKDAAAQVQAQVAAAVAAGHGSATSAASLSFCTEG